MSALISAGFGEPVHDSQATFRAALEALSRPGRIQSVTSPVETPPGTSAAAYALLLSLADHQTPVWLRDTSHPLANALRFHTGCLITDEPATATFALLRAGSGPALADFALGDDETPERSTTLIIEVGSLSEGATRRLSGPGIEAVHTLRCSALSERFLADWRTNNARFPAGVDAFLTAGETLVGLPRTTRIDF